MDLAQNQTVQRLTSHSSLHLDNFLQSLRRAFDPVTPPSGPFLKPEFLFEPFPSISWLLGVYEDQNTRLS
jgi:hypothetical protein